MKLLYYKFIKEHKIHKIENIHYIPLFEEYNNKQMLSLEEKYMKILKEFDLSLGFYFSNSYDLTNPLSKNITKNLKNSDSKHKKSFEKSSSFKDTNNYKSMDQAHQILYLESYFDFFAWNHNLISDFNEKIANKRWILPIIHGYLEQKSKYNKKF